jgi:phage gpG-like protein
MTTTDFDTRALQKVVDEFAKKGGETERLMPTVASILVEAVDYQFDTEGKGTWKKSARAILQGGKTLQDHGFLADIQPDHGKDWGEAYSDLPYAGFHLPPEKSGHPVTTGKMPVRDYLAIDEQEALEEIGDLFTAFVTDV